MNDKLSLKEVEDWLAKMNYGGMVHDMAQQLADFMRENTALKSQIDFLDEHIGKSADEEIRLTRENQRIREKGHIDAMETANLKEDNDRLRKMLDKCWTGEWFPGNEDFAEALYPNKDSK